MVCLDKIGLFSPKGPALLIEQLDDAFDKLNRAGRDPELFARKAKESSCVDPTYGRYVAKHGIDRILVWQQLTEENFDEFAPRFLRRKDLPFIRRIPAHLDRCLKCVYESYRYMLFLKEHHGISHMMAQDYVEQCQRAGPLSDEEVGRIYDSTRMLAHCMLVSVDRMRRCDAAIRKIESVPCTKPTLSRQFKKNGILVTSRHLLMTTWQLERMGSRLRRWTPERRTGLLTTMSQHVAGCRHCTLWYTFEKNEALYQEIVYKEL